MRRPTRGARHIVGRDRRPCACSALGGTVVADASRHHRSTRAGEDGLRQGRPTGSFHAAGHRRIRFHVKQEGALPGAYGPRPWTNGNQRLRRPGSSGLLTLPRGVSRETTPHRLDSGCRHSADSWCRPSEAGVEHKTRASGSVDLEGSRGAAASRCVRRTHSRRTAGTPRALASDGRRVRHWTGTKAVTSPIPARPLGRLNERPDAEEAGHPRQPSVRGVTAVRWIAVKGRSVAGDTTFPIHTKCRSHHPAGHPPDEHAVDGRPAVVDGVGHRGRPSGFVCREPPQQGELGEIERETLQGRRWPHSALDRCVSRHERTSGQGSPTVGTNQTFHVKRRRPAQQGPRRSVCREALRQHQSPHSRRD